MDVEPVRDGRKCTVDIESEEVSTDDYDDFEMDSGHTAAGARSGQATGWAWSRGRPSSRHRQRRNFDSLPPGRRASADGDQLLERSLTACRTPNCRCRRCSLGRNCEVASSMVNDSYEVSRRREARAPGPVRTCRQGQGRQRRAAHTGSGRNGAACGCTGVAIPTRDGRELCTSAFLFGRPEVQGSTCDANAAARLYIERYMRVPPTVT
jgi:hypothetical protein